MKKILCLLFLFLIAQININAQITNGNINYELFAEQWYQGCNNDTSPNSDDNMVRCSVTSDPATGGIITNNNTGTCTSPYGFVHNWSADAPSTTMSKNSIYSATNRNATAGTLAYTIQSWESDNGFNCFPLSGDGCKMDAKNFSVTYKNTTKKPNQWWGVQGSADLVDWSSTTDQGRVSLKTIWTYTNGHDCANPLIFGTLNSGTIYSHYNNNRQTPGDARTEMGNQSTYGNYAPDVYYSFTINEASTVVISTISSSTNYDSYIRLFSNCSTEIDNNDDFVGTQSQITKDLCPGTYIILVEGYGYNVGDFELSVNATIKPTNGGVIGSSPLSICSGTSLSTFFNTTSASGFGNITYQWESSTTSSTSGFSNIPTATSESYSPTSVVPTQTTWFRRKAIDDCYRVFYSNTIQITINTPSTEPTAITGTTTICSGASTTLTATGMTLGTGANVQWLTFSCNGMILGTGNTLTVSPSSTTTYYARVVGTCNTTSCISTTVTVNTLSTDPTSIIGNTTICAGASTKLTATGMTLGTGANIQWFSGSCASTIIGTGNTLTVSPTSTTTYYARVEGTCNTTSCISTTVTVNTLSTAPTAVTGNSTICAGSTTTLTATGMTLGTGANVQWFSGSCGSTIIGTGNTLTVSPSSLTTYVATVGGTCNTTSCISTMVTIYTLSTAPTAITGTTTVCNGSSTTLTATGMSLGTGGVIKWYTGSCGGTLIGTGASISVSPTSNTTYFVRVEGFCNSTTCTSSTVTVNALPNNLTNAINPTEICYRANAEIEIHGTQNSVSYQLMNGASTIGGAQTGNGGTLTFYTNPITSTTNYSIIATAASGCTRNMTLPAISPSVNATAISTDGMQKTCILFGDHQFVEFTTGTYAIAAINPRGQNLGNVTITSYVDNHSIPVQACNFNSPLYNFEAMGRRWVVTAENTPTDNVDVRLYFNNSEYTTLQTASLANTAVDDDVTSIASLKMTKYSGLNENGSFIDNCGNGVMTNHTNTSTGNTDLSILPIAISNAHHATYTVSSFSEMWLSGSSNNSPLPVTLTNFDVVCNDSYILINWSTASEQNNSYFIVEKLNDLQQWESFQTMNGAVNATTSNTYSIRDESINNEISYYRLKQVDINGSTTTYEPKSVLCKPTVKKIVVIPNPIVESTAQLIIPTVEFEGEVSISLVDNLGRIVYNIPIKLSKGINQHTLDVRGLEQGIYNLHFSVKHSELYEIKVRID